MKKILILSRTALIATLVILLLAILATGYFLIKIKWSANNIIEPTQQNEAVNNNLAGNNNLSIASSSLISSGDIDYNKTPAVVVARIPAVLNFSTSSISDMNSFKPLNSYWAKDNYNVYLLCGSYNEGTTTKIVQDADVGSFEILQDYSSYEGYAKDKNHVYYRANNSFSIVDEADPATFEALPYGLAKDEHNVYLSYSYGSTFNPIVVAVNGAEIKTFQMLSDYYAKDKNHVYYTAVYGKVGVIVGADSETFKLSSDGSYATDKSHVFLGSTKSYLIGADPDTFRAFGDSTHSVDVFVDKNHVYTSTSISGTNRSEAKIVQDADPATLQLDEARAYAKDKNYVYDYNFNIVDGADSATFKMLNAGWYEDQNHIYFLKKRVFQVFQGADSKTFSIMKAACLEGCQCYDYYAKDKSQVYYDGQVIVGADPATFMILGNGDLAKDKNGIYSNGEKNETLSQADISSFQMVGDGNIFAKDKNIVYNLSSHYANYVNLANVKFDAATFEYLGGGFLWR